MNRLTEEQLTAWEALANAATEGPWYDDEYADITSDADGMDAYVGDLLNRDNARFIAESREAVPALVAEVRRLRDGLERMARVFGDDQAGVWLAHLERELETALVKRPMDPMHWPTFATGLSFGYVSGMVVAMVAALLTGQSLDDVSSDLPGRGNRDEK